MDVSSKAELGRSPFFWETMCNLLSPFSRAFRKLHRWHISIESCSFVGIRVRKTIYMIPYLVGLLGLAGVAAMYNTVVTKRKRLQELLEEYEALFSVPRTVMELVRDAMVQQMELGLQGKEGGLMMLPSFVDILPTGEETGEFFAIDLGGTNMRVLRVSLQGHGTLRQTALEKWPIPPECFDTDTGRLLDWVAENTLKVAHGSGHSTGSDAAPLVIGLCFSFAFQQTALDNGKLLLWTKNFRGSALVGQDIVAALAAAFAARGAAVRIPAIMNDTVATLVALRYSEPATRAGIILGTGTNCAYLERVERIATLPPAYRPRGPEMVVNTEWGDLGAEALPRCQEDVWLDLASGNPGRGVFEKLVAGLYMGEVARRVMLRLADEGGLFGGAGCGVPGKGLARQGAFGSAALADVDRDESCDLGATAAAVQAAFGVARPSRADLAVVQRVCRMVSLRGARLCAAAVAAILTHACGEGGASAESPVVIAVDGSVFEKYAGYRDLLQEGLSELIGEAGARAVRLQMVPDASIMGAAFLAATAAAKQPE